MPGSFTPPVRVAIVTLDHHLKGAVERADADLGPDNVLRFLEGIDLVVDGFDNFEGRYVLNDACVKQGVPWIYGACVGSYGLTFPILPGETACLRCVFESPPPPGLSPSCDTAGVIGPKAPRGNKPATRRKSRRRPNRLRRGIAADRCGFGRAAAA